MLHKNIKISAQNVIKSTLYQYYHNNHNSLHFIQQWTVVTYMNSHKLHCNKKQCISPLYYTKRQFAILEKQDKAQDDTNNDNVTITNTETTTTPNTTRETNKNEATGKEKHIEVHAFRSLITIAEYVLIVLYNKLF